MYKKITYGTLFVGLYIFVLFFSLTELLPYKMLACACFLLVAIAGFFFHRNRLQKADALKPGNVLLFPCILFLALTVATVGDIIIFYSIIPGICLFALGHLFYICSYHRLSSFQKKDLLCCIPFFVFAVSLLLFRPLIAFDSNLMLLICLGYGAIISTMVGKALSNMLILKNSVSKIIFFGSLFFVISDACVILDTYATIPGPYRYVGRVLYFGGQYLLALSIQNYFSSSET